MFLPPPKQPAQPTNQAWPGAVQRSLRDRIVETLRYLSDEIEPRRVGGLGEAQAAGYIAGRLRRAEYAAAVQSFKAGVGEKPSLIFLATLATIAGIVAAARFAPVWTAIAALGSVVVLLLLLAEIEGPEPLRTILNGPTSQSVVAGRAVSSKKMQARVVVIAPLDGPPRPVLQRSGLLLLLGALIVQIVGSSVLLFAFSDGWRLVVGGCAAISGVLAVGMLGRRSVPAMLPAIHGAGELTTLLMVAEELQPRESLEVWMVALGGSAVGHKSVRAILERYPFSPSDTYLINLHHINAGQPVFVTREGVLRERRSDRTLLASAADADAADITIDAEPRRLRERTLAQSLLSRGFRAITISSHRDASPFTSPDAETIDRCVRLVVGIISKLDA